MFFEMDKSYFPIIKIKINNSPITDVDFNIFLDAWRELYNEKKHFTFIFDTHEINNPSLKYAIQMASFIRELRKNEIQYLQKSIILINNNNIKWLLEFIFLIQPPVATVYIYNIENGIQEKMQEYIFNIMNHENTIKIEKGEPLISIF
jgi:hypothetical protein